MWVGLIQSGEGLVRTPKKNPKNKLSKQERILQQMAFRLHLYHWLSWVSRLLACNADFGLAGLHSFMHQFLIINLFLRIHISYWFCFSGEPWLIHKFLFILPSTLIPNPSTQFIPQIFSEHYIWTRHCTRFDYKVETIFFSVQSYSAHGLPSLVSPPMSPWITWSLKTSLRRTSGTEFQIDERLSAYQCW